MALRQQVNLENGLRMERQLDSTDWKILRELQRDARLSYNALGRRVGLSAPAVAERVRKLEDAGVITGYRAQVDPAKVGLPLTAWIQLRCASERCLLKTRRPDEYPEIHEVYKLSGERCTLLKVMAESMGHLEAVIERLGKHGEMWTSIVLSSPMADRVIDWERGAARDDELLRRSWD
jgi:Lrp/AsnC family leucine-responsive transcriptional regulator